MPCSRKPGLLAEPAKPFPYGPAPNGTGGEIQRTVRSADSDGDTPAELFPRIWAQSDAVLGAHGAGGGASCRRETEIPAPTVVTPRVQPTEACFIQPVRGRSAYSPATALTGMK